MADTLPFPDQLCNWLISISFPCNLVREPDFTLPVALIGDGDRVVMKIIPVEFEAWRKSDGTKLLHDITLKLASIRNAGILAVVLWEDYWLAKRSIVQSRLTSMLGRSARIPARLTLARRIDNALTTQFLDDNHLNGPTTSKFRYGLFLPKRYYRVLPSNFAFDQQPEELLVAIATFSNARIFEQGAQPFRSHELIRFASLQGTNVVGALDKLLNAFIREKAPDDIMTYADHEWSDGRSYLRLNFEERGSMAPREVLVDLRNMARVSKTPELAEISSIDYLTVFNLGSTKYVKTIKPAPDEP